MKLALSATSLAMMMARSLLNNSPTSVEAFSSPRMMVRATRSATRNFELSATANSNEQSSTTPCDVMEDNEERIASTTADILRSAQVVNIKGDRITLGDQMKDGTSIVVFLRHLG